ncbi:MAG: hypothetical protein HYZ42_03055 [Bacteroidetes bacterium]|nr:hypothetical protein [Bacteroidota bacterium]
MASNKSLSYLFIANAISGFAQGISMLAIPWYFNSQHLSQYFNVSYGIITILVIFWGLYAGTLVDKYNRKKVFLYLNVVCGGAFLLISLAGLLDLVPSSDIHQILIVTVFGITMFNYNIHYPALYALGQELVPASDYGKFNSKIEIVGQSVSILSGGLAAMMLDGIHINEPVDLYVYSFRFPFELKAWSIDFIILLNALAHLLAVAFIVPIKYVFTIKSGINESLKERLYMGFTFLKGHREILIFGLASYTVFAMLLVEIHAVLPGFIERQLKMGGAVFAIADTVYAVGALGAGIMVRRLFQARKVRSSVILLTIITALFFAWNSLVDMVFVTLLMSLILC